MQTTFFRIVLLYFFCPSEWLSRAGMPNRVPPKALAVAQRKEAKKDTIPLAIEKNPPDWYEAVSAKAGTTYRTDFAF